MTLMLGAFILLTGAELLVVSRSVQTLRRPVAISIAFTTAFVTGILLGERFSLAMVLVAIIGLYRIINMLRVVQNRSEEHYLRSSVRKTTISLSLLQFFVLAVLALSDYTHPKPDIWWSLLSLVQLAVVVILFLTTTRQLRTTLAPDVSEHFADTHLPSLSVCIPARNETESLEDCLRSLVASDYPKLEIIVLDDCSQASRTSEIIRGFAHDGVRFIKGEPAPDGWLAKNWAYQQLFEASSGSHLLFCGADIRFEPPTLRHAVTTLLARNKRMSSIIPRNYLPSGLLNQVSLLIQPVRYAWEMSLPRRLFNRPPVLSSCWLAERTLIDRTGSFAAVTHSIVPEAYFARKAILRDGYSFIRSGQGMEIASSKGLADLWETAVRTRYPQLRRRLDMVLIVSLLQLSLFVAPLLLFAIGLTQGLWLQAAAAGLTILIICITYAQLVDLTYRRFLLGSLVMAPLAALLDICIRHESLWRYEFGEVTWKGRNVCLPVMHVTPRLPKL